jgi:flagellar hook-length control protein FliK
VLAKIEVQNQQVKEIMERNLPMLKDALAQQNISAGQFDISIGTGMGRHTGGQAHNPWNNEDMVYGGLHENGHEKDEDPSSRKQQRQEDETGRRFGNNSIEYFA